MIPFLDLKKLNQRYQAEFQDQFSSLLDSGVYIKGQQVHKFERAFADYCGTKDCVGTANGLDALTLILKAYQHLGRLKKGDKVLVPSNTFIATILSVLNAELIPVLVEPNDETFNIDIDGVESSYSTEVKAVIVVHLYGQLVDMDPIQSFCKIRNVLLIEDAAQAHGARDDKGRSAGNLGDAAAFSFYPAKNLGALGDAGAVTTNDLSLSETVRLLGNYGSSKKYVYNSVGLNSRLDALQAAFLGVKLNNLDKDNERRRDIARRYSAEIKNLKIRLPFFSGNQDHVFYVYVIRVEDREDMIRYLKANEIIPHIHYPIAPNLQTALKSYKFGPCPISERMHQRVLSIPLNPVLSDHDVEHIIHVLNTY